MQLNPYKVLGVTPDAGKSEIKQNFLKLSQKFGPDANGGNPAANEAYIHIVKSYKILTDPDQASDRTFWRNNYSLDKRETSSNDFSDGRQERELRAEISSLRQKLDTAIRALDRMEKLRNERAEEVETWRKSYYSMMKQRDLAQEDLRKARQSWASELNEKFSIDRKPSTTFPKDPSIKNFAKSKMNPKLRHDK